MTGIPPTPMYMHAYTLSSGQLYSNFYLFCFWAVLKKLPIMLNNMPITTAILQFVYEFMTRSA